MLARPDALQNGSFCPACIWKQHSRFWFVFCHVNVSQHTLHNWTQAMVVNYKLIFLSVRRYNPETTLCWLLTACQQNHVGRACSHFCTEQKKYKESWLGKQVVIKSIFTYLRFWTTVNQWVLITSSKTVCTYFIKYTKYCITLKYIYVVGILMSMH